MHRRTTLKLALVFAIVGGWYAVFAAAGPKVYLPVIRYDVPPTPTATATPTATETPSPTATATDTAQPTATATPTPTDTATPEPTATPTPTATQTPTTVVVLSASIRFSSGGYASIPGEIENFTGGNVRFVHIVASLYDGSGVFLGSESTYTIIDIVRPGQRSPFSIYLSSRYPTLNRYQLQLEWDATSEQPGGGLTLLSIADRAASIDGWQYVYGQVQNTSNHPIQFGKVIVTGYDAGGTVVAADYSYTKLETLNPGETSPYEILVTTWTGVARYEVITDAP